MNDINLIQGENKTSSEKRNRVLVLHYISLVFLAFVAILSILLFVLNNRISPEDVKTQEAETLSKIVQLKDRSAKYGLLVDRLKEITSILGSRKKYAATLNSVLEQVPSDVLLKNLTLDKSGLSLTATSNSLLPLSTFLTNVTKISLEKHVIRNLTIEGLTIDKQAGTYSLSLKADSL